MQILQPVQVSGESSRGYILPQRSTPPSETLIHLKGQAMTQTPQVMKRLKSKTGTRRGVPAILLCILKLRGLMPCFTLKKLT